MHYTKGTKGYRENGFPNISELEEAKRPEQFPVGQCSQMQKKVQLTQMCSIKQHFTHFNNKCTFMKQSRQHTTNEIPLFFVSTSNYLVLTAVNLTKLCGTFILVPWCIEKFRKKYIKTLSVDQNTPGCIFLSSKVISVYLCVYILLNKVITLKLVDMLVITLLEL